MQIEILDKKTEASIESITTKIKLRKNGVSADAMRDAGIIYKMNYGVSIVHLRTIAKQHEANNKLAFALWNMQWRETMIIATMLWQVKSVVAEDLMEAVKQSHTDELYQQLGMNTVCKLPMAEELIISYLKSSEVSLKCVACYALVRRAMLKLSDANFFDVATAHILNFKITDPLVWTEINAMSKAIAKTGMSGTLDKSEILDYFANKSEQHKYWKIAYENIKTEFEYR